MALGAQAAVPPELYRKIEAARSIIRDAYVKNGGKLFISFSGGKDSTVLRHIVLSMYPELKSVFSNTTNELAEIVRYVKQFEGVITVVPTISFTEVITRYGFPLISKEVSQKISELKHTQSKTLRYGRLDGDAKGNGKLPDKWRYVAEQAFDVTHKCCKILKKDPLEKWAKAHRLKPIIALMADESKLRQQLALYGDNDKKIYPLLRTGWCEADIWAYAEFYGIRFAECYYDRIVDGVLVEALERSGCEYCGFGNTLEKKDRFERSMIVSPKRYEKIMSIQNNGVTFKEAIDIVKEPASPIIDLYGVKYKGLRHYHNQSKRYYDMESTVRHKRCPQCGSKDISETPILYNGGFYDTPHPQTGEKRTINVRWFSYDCKGCGRSTVSGDLHMINTEFGVTDRLIRYIADSLNVKSSGQIIDETGIDRDTLYKILTMNKEVLSRFTALRTSEGAA